MTGVLIKRVNLNPETEVCMGKHQVNAGVKLSQSKELSEGREKPGADSLHLALGAQRSFLRRGDI